MVKLLLIVFGLFAFSCDSEDILNYILEEEGCIDESACNYDENANEYDDSCIYAQENLDCDGVVVNVCGYDDFEYLSGCTTSTCIAYGLEGLEVIADGYCEITGYTNAVSYDVITTGSLQKVLNIGCDWSEVIYDNYSCDNVEYCGGIGSNWDASDSWPVISNLVCE